MAVLLVLTGCNPGDTTPTTTPAQAPKPPSALDVYRACVGPNRSSRDLQSKCQVKAWGDAFSDDDDRWSCLDMGYLQCGPSERKA